MAAACGRQGMTGEELYERKGEYELIHHFALSQINPAALETFRRHGKCWFDLEEQLFDRQYPGHYMRRIHAVFLFIHCDVAAPVLTAKLTLVKNSTRFSSATVLPYERQSGDGIFLPDPNRFIDDDRPLTAVFRSSVNQECGLLTSLENGNEDRFYHAGVISTWELAIMPPLTPSIIRKTEAQDQHLDYCSDVILKLHFTARDGGGLQELAVTSLMNRLKIQNRDEQQPGETNGG